MIIGGYKVVPINLKYDCNWTRSPTQLVSKRTVNYSASLLSWLSVRLSTKGM